MIDTQTLSWKTSSREGGDAKIVGCGWKRRLAAQMLTFSWAASSSYCPALDTDPGSRWEREKPVLTSESSGSQLRSAEHTAFASTAGTRSEARSPRT